MIFGISGFISLIKSLSGAGISALAIASAAPSSNNNPISVEQAFTSRPMMVRLTTRNMMVPRRMVVVDVMIFEGTVGLRMSRECETEVKRIYEDMARNLSRS